MKDFLSLEQRKELRRVHKKERSRRNADRMKTILLLDSGWTYEQGAEVLLLDDQTIRNYEITYQSKGLEVLLSDSYSTPNMRPNIPRVLQEHNKLSMIGILANFRIISP